MKKQVHKKGDAGEILFTIFAAILIFFFLMVVMTSVTSSNQKSQEIVLEELAIVKAKNTFFLVQRSLGMTWYVSAAQSIFRTGYESVGCGIDEEDEGLSKDAMKDNYWYQYSDTKLPKKSGLPPPQDKYNFNPLSVNTAPLICYPRGALEEGHLLAYLNKKFAPFKEIPDKFTANGVPFIIQDMQTDFVVKDDEIDTKSNQSVTANPNTQPRIVAPVTNDNVIYTKLKQMVAGARKVVDNAIALSDSLKTGSRAGSELLFTPSSTADNYKSDAKTKIKNKFQSVLPKNAFRIDVTYKPGNDIELRAGDDDELGYKEKGAGSPYQFTKQGLILHYDADISIRELGDVSFSGTACDATPFSAAVENAVSAWEFSDTDIHLGLIPWVTTTFDYSKDEVRAFVTAIVQAESLRADDGSCDPSSISCAGAAGLMQLIPETARSYGLYVPMYGTDTVTCPGSISNIDDNRCNSITPAACRPVEDDRFDAQKNIQGGTKYLHSLFNKLAEYTKDKDALMKLAAAAYNGGPGEKGKQEGVIGAIEKAVKNDGADANNIKFSDIEKYLPDQTQAYVPRVLGFYVANGGSISSSSYYYHDEKNNRFTPRPFELDMSVEDNLNVLDCVNDVPAGTNPPPYVLYGWTTQGDMACCGGALWTCNANPAVQNIGNHALQSGQNVVSQDDSKDTDYQPSRICANAVSLSRPNKAGLIYTLGCTADGFGVVSYVP